MSIIVATQNVVLELDHRGSEKAEAVQGQEIGRVVVTLFAYSPKHTFRGGHGVRRRT